MMILLVVIVGVTIQLVVDTLTSAITFALKWKTWKAVGLRLAGMVCLWVLMTFLIINFFYH